MSKLQIRKVIETPILNKDGKPSKSKTESTEDIKIVHRVDYLEPGSWRDQGYEVLAEAGMDFKKQRYGASEDDNSK